MVRLVLGRLVPKLKEDYVPNGVPVVRGVNLARGIFHDDDFVFITQDLANKMPGASLVAGDLVITHRGTLGQVSMIPRGCRYHTYVASTSHVKARLNPMKALPEFYYYWFHSSEGQRSLLAHASPVGVPGIAQPVATVKAIRVPWPPLPTQRAIAEVLGALDDKIAANDQIARSADELLSDVFASISASAPASRLADLARVNAVTTQPAPSGRVRYLDISAVSTGRYEMPVAISWDEAPARARRVVGNGDTVWSTVRPNRRSHALILDESEELVGSTGLAVISPVSARVASVYECTRRDAFVHYLESVAEGSAYPAVRGDRFLDAPIPHLPEEQWDDFESLALPLRRRAAAAMRENRALAMTRDELLPLLMSGRIRVRDAEKVVEGAV